jgi:ABC-type lipopolysaccharide export system ATPase subunit
MVTGTIALSGKKEELKENEVIKEIYLGKKLQ